MLFNDGDIQMNFASVPDVFLENYTVEFLENATKDSGLILWRSSGQSFNKDRQDWTSLNVNEGTLAPGEMTPIEVILDATRLQPGAYSNELVLDWERRLDDPKVSIPLILEVQAPSM